MIINFLAGFLQFKKENFPLLKLNAWAYFLGNGNISEKDKIQLFFLFQSLSSLIRHLMIHTFDQVLRIELKQKNLLFFCYSPK